LLCFVVEPRIYRCYVVRVVCSTWPTRHTRTARLYTFANTVTPTRLPCWESYIATALNLPVGLEITTPPLPLTTRSELLVFYHGAGRPRDSRPMRYSNIAFGCVLFVSLNGDKQDRAKQGLMVSRRGSTNLLEGMGSQKVFSRS